MKKYIGYIEGYYGRILTWDQRVSLLDHLSSLSMNTYFYAPKEDPFHRFLWKRKYSASWLQNFNRFIITGKRKKVTVIPAVAPGLTFDYLSKKDYNHLLNKYKSFIKAGADTLALLMDDISDSLPDTCKKNFSSLGEAHGLLLSKLLADLKKENKNVSLWFCPTIYTDQFVKGNAVESKYIIDLVAKMPRTVIFMWTGPKVVSEKLNQKNLESIIKAVKGNLIVWDNFYANDYAPLRLFVGPYTGRSFGILKSTKGILINPTGLFNTDKFLLSLFSEFLKTKKATLSGWEKIAKEYAIPNDFLKIKKFFWSPFVKPTANDFSNKAIKKYGDLFNDLVVGWQNILKLEWYPYLQSFQQDIGCFQMDKKSQIPWQYRHYPPLIAQRMDKS